MNYENDTFLSTLLNLLELTSNKKHEKIKEILQNGCESQYGKSISKGILAENYIAELLIGNNSWTKTTPMKDDYGIDIIEYTRTGYSLSKCYQIKNQQNPLSESEVTNEIEKFKRSNYRRLPYYILSISGFTFDKNNLVHSNVYLADYEFVISLINNYSKKLNSCPGSTYFLEDCNFITNFNIILNYYNKHGQYNYLDKLPQNLLSWCTKIRMSKKEGKLNIKYVHLLNSINFYWSHNDYLWDKSFNEIKDIYDEFGKTFGFVNFPTNKAWIKAQVNAYITGELFKNRIEKLKSINLLNEWLLNI